MRATRKIVAAVSTVVALLLALAAPAAADTRNADVGGGTLVTAGGSFSLAPGGTVPCPQKPSTLGVTTAGNAITGTWSVGGTFSRQIQVPAGSGSWYQVDFTVTQAAAGGYTISSVGPPTWTYGLTGQLIVQMDVHSIGTVGQPGFPSCAKSLYCRIIGGFGITQGTYRGSVALPTLTVAPAAPSLLGRLVLDASTTAFGSPLVVQLCPNPPFNALGGTNASLAALEIRIL